MKSAHTLIAQAYAAFNARDVDRALTLMSEDVSWPKASEGGRVSGKETIRAYWMRQWKEFDPHVEPRAMTDRSDGLIEVEVHQLVKDLRGYVVSESEVRHVFTMANEKIVRMDLEATEGQASPEAFPR